MRRLWVRASRLPGILFLLTLAALILAAGATPHTGAQERTVAPERTVAVTFDDLPATTAGVVANDVASLEKLTRQLLSAVRKHRIPAVAFVNEGGLFVEGEGPRDVEARTGLLRMWLDAGIELGNHTYSHRDLNRLPLDQFQADVLRGEAVTRALLKERERRGEKGLRLRYFRHPFLHVGADLKTRRAFEAFLTSHGYTVAPVTVDSDEFVYAKVYADALRRGDTATAARIADDYLRYMDEVFTFFEAVSRRVTGREISQILLLHANQLNADRFDALAEALTRRGYRFVTVARALEDPAYRLRDEFVGAPRTPGSITGRSPRAARRCRRRVRRSGSGRSDRMPLTVDSTILASAPRFVRTGRRGGLACFCHWSAFRSRGSTRLSCTAAASLLGLTVVSLETGRPGSARDSVSRNVIFLLPAPMSPRSFSRRGHCRAIGRVCAWATASP